MRTHRVIATAWCAAAVLVGAFDIRTQDTPPPKEGQRNYSP